jgi:hypothetical protein
MPTAGNRTGNPVLSPSRYSNYFQAGFNEFELVIEFGEFYSDHPEPSLHTRVITSPEYAKRLLAVLREALQQHEEQFGSPHGDRH